MSYEVLKEHIGQSPIGRAGIFSYVRKITEATVQAELYARLTQEGFAVQLEVPFRTKGAKIKLRADLGVFCCQTKELFALVETKSSKKKPKREASKRVFEEQAAKYELTQLPWTYCHGWAELDQTISWVLAQYRARGGAVPSRVDFMGPAQATPSGLRPSVEEETSH